jgi:hypothetical protein
MGPWFTYAITIPVVINTTPPIPATLMPGISRNSTTKRSSPITIRSITIDMFY